MYQSIIHGIKHISTKLTVVFNLDCSGQSSRVAPRGRGGGGEEEEEEGTQQSFNRGSSAPMSNPFIYHF